MVQDDIIEGNKLIADFHSFIGSPFEEKEILDLKYHSSWDWLMPVVEKIETLNNGAYQLTIDPWRIEIIEYESGKEEVIVSFLNDDGYSKIKQYYTVVVDFIRWYNKQEQNKL